MGVGLDFKVPGAIFKAALLMALFLTIASGSAVPCDDVNQTCEQHWNLRTQANDGPVLAYYDNLAADLSAFGTTTIAFDYLNQSSSAVMQRVATGNDTAKYIKLTANDINNDLLSYIAVGLPSHGNISGAGSNIIYIPEEGYVGNDTIIMGVNDEAGGLQNITVSIDVLLSYHPPSVRIRSPMNGELFTADPVTIQALVPIRATSSGNVSGIQFYDGQKLISALMPCELEAADCAATFLAPLEIGTHVLTAVANDSTGKSCTSLPVVIIVNPPEPLVEITGPLAGEIFTAPANITITAEVKDSSPVESVEFFANSMSLGMAIESQSPYSVIWQDAMPGVYKLVARATDVTGSVAYSKPILVVVVPVKPLSKSDLALTMSASPSPVPAGGLQNYVIILTNRGPDSASNVFVEDFLPSRMKYVSHEASQGKYNNSTGLWNVGDLTEYRSARLVITTRVPLNATAGQIYNTAYAYSAQSDPDNSNNHATAYTRLKPIAAAPIEQNSTAE